MVAFPEIRGPLKDGWDGAAPNGVRVSPMDDGPPKRRPGSDAIGAAEGFIYKLTDEERATLDEFYAANKAARFDFAHPVWGAVEACFTRAPSWRQSGPWFLASVELEIYR